MRLCVLNAYLNVTIMTRQVLYIKKITYWLIVSGKGFTDAF